MADEFVTVARLRAEMADILARLEPDKGPVYVTQRGLPRAVLMDVEEYRALMDRLEYLDDSLEAMLVNERIERGEETVRPLADVLRDLQAKHRGKTRRRRGRLSR